MRQIVIIDRFEEKIAICENTNRSMVSFTRSFLPPEAREGDVVIIENQATRIDRAATAARKMAVEEKQRQIMKQNG